MSNNGQAKVNATLVIVALSAFLSAIVLAIPASSLHHSLTLIIVLSPMIRWVIYVWSK